MRRARPRSRHLRLPRPEPRSWERACAGLSVRHEVLAIEVVDPRELDLPEVGLLTVVDPETGDVRDVHTSSRLRARYAGRRRGRARRHRHGHPRRRRRPSRVAHRPRLARATSCASWPCAAGASSAHRRSSPDAARRLPLTGPPVVAAGRCCARRRVLGTPVATQAVRRALHQHGAARQGRAPERPGGAATCRPAAFVAALAGIVMAYARPADEVRVPRERATIIMAIDVSLSMEADDVSPTRLAAAQAAAASFLDEVPETINVGLVTFDGIATRRGAADHRPPARRQRHRPICASDPAPPSARPSSRPSTPSTWLRRDRTRPSRRRPRSCSCPTARRRPVARTRKASPSRSSARFPCPPSRSARLAARSSSRARA